VEFRSVAAEMQRKRETIRSRRLIEHCGNWRKASDIRAFVAAVEASAPAAENLEGFAGWKSWALGHADRIDPMRDDDLYNQHVDDYEIYPLRD
jgi:hypothetical protein